MSKPTSIVIAKGDGIGPEIMDATLRILEAAGAKLKYHEIEVGEKVYLKGTSSGIAPESWDLLRKHGVLLKAPITTPQGGGYKSLNVTIRTSMGLYANVRPCRSYTPYVDSHFPMMNLVIIRENEEDLYSGIEHQQTAEVVQCLKLVSRPGSEKIIRYAFEYARLYGRKKVTCMSKDNIMKLSDGMFHSIFNEIAEEYPDIESDHKIIDIGSALVADRPEDFDVIVTLNLYGDILSDIAAQVAGSVGLCGSANIGKTFGMFEAIHGSAPDIAGKGIANPSGLINGAIMMLVHIGQGDIATKVENALLSTLEEGIHTGDIFNDTNSTKKVNTQEFADAVIERLGNQPQNLRVAKYAKESKSINVSLNSKQAANKELTGVDVFLDWSSSDRNPEVLGKKLGEIASPDFKLHVITNRGVKVYPTRMPETFLTDHWRCRFMHNSNSNKATNANIIKLLNRIDKEGLDIIKTEHLYKFDGKQAYSQIPGE